jgi:hypothetical protein
MGSTVTLYLDHYRNEAGIHTKVEEPYVEGNIHAACWEITGTPGENDLSALSFRLGELHTLS